MWSLLLLILSFYKKFFWYSLLLNFLFLGFKVPAGLAVFYKLLLTICVLWNYKISGNGQALVFYNNLKITTFKLFSLSFLYDIILLLFTYSLSLLLL